MFIEPLIAETSTITTEMNAPVGTRTKTHTKMTS